MTNLTPRQRKLARIAAAADAVGFCADEGLLPTPEQEDAIALAARPDPVGLAFSIARQAHAGQTDKAGLPYLFHPVAVAVGVADHGEVAVAAALLHDVVEDSGMTLGNLVDAGVPLEAVAVVDALTKRPGEDYGEFVQRVVAAGMPAIAVKLADIAHNLDATRLARLDVEVVERLRRKYLPVTAVLEAARDRAVTEGPMR